MGSLFSRELHEMAKAQRGDEMAGTVGAGHPTASGILTYTIPGAARVSGVSASTIRRLEKAGRLRFVRVGGRTLVCAASLRALLAVGG